MYYELEDIAFWGMNIPKELNSIMEKFESDITKDMDDEQKRAYKLGVSNSISLLEQILVVSEPNDIVFYNKDCEMTEEFSLRDLEKRLTKE